MAADQSSARVKAALEQALETSPGNHEVALSLGRLEFVEGRLDRAEELFRQAAASGSARALAMLGLTLSRQGRYRQALQYLQEATRTEPGNAQAWNGLGEVLGNLGRTTEALRAFVLATRLDPVFAQAHYNAGLALRSLGNSRAAIQALRAALRVKPGFAEALHALGGLLHASGQYQAAVDCLRELVQIRPEDPEAHTSLGASAQMLGDLDTARRCYERAVELAPRYPEAHSNLGTVYQVQREVDLAETCFRRALDIDPANPDALGGIALCLDRRGNYTDALGMIETRLMDGPIELGITGAQILSHMGRNEDALRLLEKLSRRKGIQVAQKQRLDFVLGSVLDDLGRFGEAFAAYRAGNAAKPVYFDCDEFQRDVAQLLDVFSPERWAALPKIEDPSERPVFVVGMPRSGTSLVEQILASHAQIAGAGELVDLGQAAIELGRDRGERFPGSMLTASEDRLRQAAKRYLGRLDAASPEAIRVTDKTPSNHLFIGFIQNLFPKARVVHCVRHPLDTCLSNYFQDFAGIGIPFSYDMSNLVVYYNNYLKVMEHWRKHAAIRMIEVVYEELVTDTERVCREIVEFLGLQWDPACLRFHESDRIVATASHAQVRRPLYRSSIGRFRHYEPWIQPLIRDIDWDAWQRSGFADRVDAVPAGGI